MDAVLSKPIAGEVLRAAIEQVLMNARTEWPLLDERVLVLLAEDIGEEGVAEVGRLFLFEAPRLIERLERAFLLRGSVLLREMHTLASAARSVGLQRVGHLAADIEHAMAKEEPSPQQLAGLLEVVRQSVERLTQWLCDARTR